jgi:hypothetical protein
MAPKLRTQLDTASVVRNNTRFFLKIAILVFLLTILLILASMIDLSAQDDIRILPNYSPAQQIKAAGDPPTLIIVIPGIGSYKEGASGEKIFNGVQEMFATQSRNYDISSINICDTTRQKGPQMTEASQQAEAQRLVANISATPHRIVHFQTQIPGIDDLIKVNLLYKLSRPRLALGTSPPGIRLYQAKIKTRWEEETKRGALSVAAMAHEFKDTYGREARVILVGHSAGTDLINSIPMADTVNGEKRQLVELRILSSARAHTLNETDPDRTIFVEHKADLPASPLADLSSPMAKGNLHSQGYVLMMRGGLEFDLADMLPGHYNIKAHNKTFDYNNFVEMDITAPNGDRIHTSYTEPGKVIREILKVNAEENKAAESGPDMDTSQKLINQIELQRPHESVVGGISLSKPAQVPLDPADIEKLEAGYPDIPVAGMPYDGFSLLMKNGDKIYLPQVEPGIEAGVFYCIYNGCVPEVGYSAIRDENNTTWKRVDYKNCDKYLPATSLGEMLIKADSVIGETAFGNTDTYTPPKTIRNYHNYNELAYDNELQNIRGGLIRLDPEQIITTLSQSRLEYERIRMAYHFRAFDIKREKEFYSGLDKGYSDPAGDFLSAQLTAGYEDEQFFHQELTLRLKETAGFAGILLWAYRNHIPVDTSTWDQVKNILAQDREQILKSGQSSLRQFYAADGNIIKDENGKDIYIFKEPYGKIHNTDFNNIARPAPIFNQYGLSRILWPDNSETRLEYTRDGLISALIGRRRDVSTILYDSDLRPLAIADSQGNGAAVIWSDPAPILCRPVQIDLNGKEVIFSKDTRFELADDIDDIFHNMYAIWLTKQAKGELTDKWLTGTSPRSKFPLLQVVAVTGLGILLLFIASQYAFAGNLKISWALHQLESGAGRARLRAVQILGHSQNPRVISALLPLFRQTTSRSGGYAFETIVRIGAPAVAQLANLLKEKDSQLYAVMALGRIGGEEAVSALTQYLYGDPENPYAWLEAAYTLAKINNPQVIQTLTAIVLSKEKCRFLMDGLRDPVTEVRQHTLEVLHILKETDVPFLAEALANNENKIKDMDLKRSP